MTDRRELLIGGACLGAAGLAYGLIPRRQVSLLGRAKLDTIVPTTFGDWTSRDVADLVAPKVEGSLASRLYGETVSRIYQQASSGAEIMMLLAHGDTQSDDLQVHRPEICYPAFGFALSASAPTQLVLGSGVTLPGRRLVAKAQERAENIVYWTRLGEFFPIDGRQQQVARLRTAFRGNVADGLLARFSLLGPDPDAATGTIAQFVRGLVHAVAPDRRQALIGTERAAALAPAP